jgi:hypothetical protein
MPYRPARWELGTDTVPKPEVQIHIAALAAATPRKNQQQPYPDNIRVSTLSGQDERASYYASQSIASWWQKSAIAWFLGTADVERRFRYWGVTCYCGEFQGLKQSNRLGMRRDPSLTPSSSIAHTARVVQVCRSRSRIVTSCL